MKNKITIVFLFLGIHLFAQNENTDETPKIRFQHEVGVNTTLLLKQVLSFSDNTIPLSPYTFTYKMIRKNKGIRFGIGGSFTSNVEKQTSFADNKTVNNQKGSARLGFEWQKNVGKKWKSWFGVDALGGISVVENVSDSGFDQVSIGTSNNSYGLGVVFGAEWRFNEHFSLATESSFNGVFTEKSDYTTFAARTQDDISKSTSGKDFSTVLPTSIFLVYKF
jgi:hypothetical protein